MVVVARLGRAAARHARRPLEVRRGERRVEVRGRAKVVAPLPVAPARLDRPPVAVQALGLHARRRGRGARDRRRCLRSARAQGEARSEHPHRDDERRDPRARRPRRPLRDDGARVRARVRSQRDDRRSSSSAPGGAAPSCAETRPTRSVRRDRRDRGSDPCRIPSPRSPREELARRRRSGRRRSSSRQRSTMASSAGGASSVAERRLAGDRHAPWR